MYMYLNFCMLNGGLTVGLLS